MADHNPMHNWTPVLESPGLNLKIGLQIHFKMECHQPSGSFKIRGVGNLMAHHNANGAKSFVCSSGGNAGLAVAHSARALGVRATIFVPETTSVEVRELLASYGVDVRVAGGVWDETDKSARDFAVSDSAIYVSPFDDRLLWAGHATMIDELAVQIPRPDAVVLSVGGGGLLCGVAAGMDRNGWRDVPIVAVETEGAASLSAAVAAGEVVTLPGITSVAKSLGALRVADEAFQWTKRRPIHAVVLPDTAAIASCVALADSLHVLVEPACGVAMAAVAARSSILDRCSNVALIVCGGNAVSARALRSWAD